MSEFFLTERVKNIFLKKGYDKDLKSFFDDVAVEKMIENSFFHYGFKRGEGLPVTHSLGNNNFTQDSRTKEEMYANIIRGHFFENFFKKEVERYIDYNQLQIDFFGADRNRRLEQKPNSNPDFILFHCCNESFKEYIEVQSTNNKDNFFTIKEHKLNRQKEKFKNVNYFVYCIPLRKKYIYTLCEIDKLKKEDVSYNLTNGKEKPKFKIPLRKENECDLSQLDSLWYNSFSDVIRVKNES